MRIITFFILLISYFNLCGQTGKSYSSRWHPVKNEKNPGDSDEYTFNKKSKLYYILSNDLTKIYITLKVDDEVVIRKILHEGLAVWIDMDNKQEKSMGIRFPVGSENIESRTIHDFSQKSLDAEKDINEAINLANTIELIGFRNELYKRFPADNSDSFAGTIKIDKNGVLHYRLILPVEKIPVRNSRNRTGALPFTIGVEYGNITSSNQAGKKDSNSKPEISGSRHQAVIMWIKNVRLAEER